MDSLNESLTRSNQLHEKLSSLRQLVSTGNFKYLSREARASYDKELLEDIGNFEDAIRALIKQVRGIKREKLRADHPGLNEIVEFMSMNSASIDGELSVSESELP